MITDITAEPTPDAGSMQAPPEQKPQNTPRWVWIAALAIIALIVLTSVWLFAQRSFQPKYGTPLDATEPAPDFTLLGSNGKSIALSDFRGKTVLLYFGYTTCPDVCPTTLADLKNAMTSLGDRAENVQVLFVTVDPERDTAEKMAGYLELFNPTFIGLTGTLADIEAVASRFGIYFAKREYEGAAQYLMDHTSAVLVLDKEGRLRMLFPYGTRGDQMAEDLSGVVE